MREASSRSSQYLNKNKASVNDKPIYMRGEKDGIDAEIALQWNDGYAETLYSVRQQHQHARGRHAPVGLALGADPHGELVRQPATISART